MKSKVYFADLRTSPKENLTAKLGRLMTTTGLGHMIHERDLVALKLHFGEQGNTAFIRPLFMRKIVQAIKELGGEPFLTDANTLYAGTRSNAAEHIRTAVQNGFAYSVVEAPLVIADGLRGKSEVRVKIGKKRFKDAYIGSEIVRADALISIAHFKGHELTGFGGTLKNVGMGCASRRGKLAQHSTVSPKIKKKRCIACGECIGHCSQHAISIVAEKAVIDSENCIGCGECILICPNKAVQIRWNQAIPVFMENMVEYTYGALLNKAEKSMFVNFITDVSPACDCVSHSDAPIVRDMGIVASLDPVAIDQASVDLVNSEPALAGSCITTPVSPGADKFKEIYPKVDWAHQFEYAERMGLGTRDYDLESI